MENANETSEAMENIAKQIRELFPEAVYVKLFVNAESYKVESEYKDNLRGYTMRKLSGEWAT
ncbi:MAG: hypothetical protein FWE09_00255 [Treponema sp.]|nr:hypothetical protein [Treponema sp.]